MTHHPSSLSSGRSHMSRTSCSLWACRALESRRATHSRVIVSGSATAYTIRAMRGTPPVHLLTCPARSFDADLRMTNSHHKSTTSGRSSAGAGRWHSTPQCLPRSKTKTPNSASSSIQLQLHSEIVFTSFFGSPGRQFECSFSASLRRPRGVTATPIDAAAADVQAVPRFFPDRR